MYRHFEADLSGRAVVVTGANKGMGKETARELARMGADVVLGFRNVQRGGEAAEEIIATTGNDRVTAMVLDLSSMGVDSDSRTPRRRAARFGDDARSRAAATSTGATASLKSWRSTTNLAVHFTQRRTGTVFRCQQVRPA
jgi:NAD(P)-dependent dehydrogenase (short-subunit alcohol dehydrogenase family)